MQKSILSIIAISIVLLLGFENCGTHGPANSPIVSGTDTGNAHAVAVLGSSLVGAICERLAYCQMSQSDSVCTDRVMALDSLPMQFGVKSTAAISTMQSLIKAEQAQVISGSLMVEQSCINELQTLSCNSPAVLAATSGGTYEGVNAFVAEAKSCNLVY